MILSIAVLSVSKSPEAARVKQVGPAEPRGGPGGLSFLLGGKRFLPKDLHTFLPFLWKQIITYVKSLHLSRFKWSISIFTSEWHDSTYNKFKHNAEKKIEVPS